MNKEHILSKAREYAKMKLQNDASGHDWWHIFRVAEWAKRIAAEEGADSFICELSALLHDLADEKLVQSKDESMEELKRWLFAHQVEMKDAEQVLDIIATLSFRGGHGEPMKSLEGQVVQDADRLDAIGAIGIARTFAYSGWKGQAMYDPDLPVRTTMTPDEYRHGKSTAINHFYEKLLTLKGRFNTPFAIQLAKERHVFMEQFLKQFFKEWNGMEEIKQDEIETYID
ncbi:HD domain-containing protein [Marinicrinis lubricantis]|uniref:HD domain-containing protein n=1 Tax=Marinicrinis lubricantis TaxID=2086470 RepID=A0ABW1IP17_9BACL